MPDRVALDVAQAELTKSITPQNLRAPRGPPPERL
jgi:hypothetical protein